MDITKALKPLLYPFSLIYSGVMSIRNLAYDRGWLKSQSFATPTIVVGNLSVGGTGKTPHVEYISQLLKNKGELAILSRGYKRKSKGFQLADKNSNALQLGDEPMQFHRKFMDVAVAVDADRCNGIKELEKRVAPQVIVLDDAFQHRKVKADFNIMLTTHASPFFKDHVLPAGRLREARSGAKRAHIIIVSKCPDKLRESDRLAYQFRIAQYSKAPVLFSSIKYADHLYGNTEVALDQLKNRKVLLISGIANPRPLHDHLTGAGIDFEPMVFPDHHNFTVEDLKNIKKEFEQLPYSDKLILTTEKDYMRLMETELMELPLCYLPISIEFNSHDRAILVDALQHLHHTS